MRSEFEGDACHFFVLLLGELVFQRRQELGVDLECETLDFLNNGCQLLVGVPGSLLHLAIPWALDFLHALNREDQRGSSDL